MSGKAGIHLTGREKCSLLKQIRKEIAESNGIVYLTSECTYQGNDCTGTCPKCDAELRYLNAELARKAESGSPITLAGLTLDSVLHVVPVKKDILDFDTPVAELHLSTQSQRCLERAGIDTVGILTSSRKKDILSLPNMNRKYFTEIMQALTEHGFSLTDNDEDVFAEMGSIPCVNSW